MLKTFQHRYGWPEAHNSGLHDYVYLEMIVVAWMEEKSDFPFFGIKNFKCFYSFGTKGLRPSRGRKAIVQLKAHLHVGLESGAFFALFSLLKYGQILIFASHQISNIALFNELQSGNVLEAGQKSNELLFAHNFISSIWHCFKFWNWKNMQRKGTRFSLSSRRRSYNYLILRHVQAKKKYLPWPDEDHEVWSHFL